MKNPYDKFGAHPCEVKAGRMTLWVFTILFVLGISVPALVRNFTDAKKESLERWVPALEFWNHPNKKGVAALAKKKERSSNITREEPSLRDHLGAVEGEIKAADFRKAIAKNDQALFTSVFNEGNTKVSVGRDGWYFYNAGIDALLGYGPLKPEPGSVMKNPDRPEWFSQVPVITKFAEQLKERGIELMLVPVPVKPMIHPEFLGADMEAPLRHRDQTALYEKLREAGIDVVDLTDDMMKWKAEGKPLYLKQDTHWTHDTMKRAAAVIAEKVKAKPYFNDLERSLSVKTETTTRTWMGDLVNMLTNDEPNKNYTVETQEIIRILNPETDEPLQSDSNSPIALLGDSFVNVYDIADIGFSKKDESQIGAGFANTLAQELGLKLDTHTANGGGATAVRKAFAESGKDRVAKKKLVIWTIASRDLLLSETPGQKASVRWRDVKFTERSASSGGKLVLLGTLKERSALDDPKSTPYASSVYSALFDNLEIIEGEYADDEAYIFMWGFKDRKLLPTSLFQPGDRIRFELIPLSDATEVKGINRADSVDAFYDPYFALTAVDPYAAKISATNEAPKPTPLKIPHAFLIFVSAIAIYVIIGITIQLRQRKTK